MNAVQVVEEREGMSKGKGINEATCCEQKNYGSRDYGFILCGKQVEGMRRRERSERFIKSHSICHFQQDRWIRVTHRQAVISSRRSSWLSWCFEEMVKNQLAPIITSILLLSCTKKFSQALVKERKSSLLTGRLASDVVFSITLRYGLDEDNFSVSPIPRSCVLTSNSLLPWEVYVTFWQTLYKI